MPDLYAILGVPRSADTAAIRKAYRKASKHAHPDSGGTPEKFQMVSKALEILSDAGRRKAYDETGTIEDKPADNAEAEMMGAVSSLLDGVLQSLDQQGVPYENADLIQRMRSMARDGQTKIHHHITAIKQMRDKQRRLVKRFKLKKKAEGANRLEAMIVGRLAWLEGQEAMANRQLDQLRRAELFLADYSFTAKKMPSRHQSPFMNMVVIG